MIYFDNAATTPLCDAAKEILKRDFFNPSSPHALGLEAERMVKAAAKDIANILSCNKDELIFTSGGTESNNLGILGVAYALKSARGKNRPLHILAGNQEHPSVTEPLKYLASLPGYSVSYAAPSDWEAHICDDTALMCVVQVSSDTGDMVDLDNLPRRKEVLLFVDGAQGFCKMPITSGVADIYSFSGHKIHGPKGVGGLMVRKQVEQQFGIRLPPLMYGGGQQNNLRPGTENVPGIVAMAEAAKAMQAIDNLTITNIKKILSDINGLGVINQHEKEASPYILSVDIPGVRGETLTNLLSTHGVYISMGTACSTAKKSKMSVETIRLSFSYMNTEEEALQAKVIIGNCIGELKR